MGRIVRLPGCGMFLSSAAVKITVRIRLPLFSPHEHKGRCPRWTRHGASSRQQTDT